MRLVALQRLFSEERVNFICANNDSLLIGTGFSESTLFTFKQCDGRLLDEKGDQRAVYSTQVGVNGPH